MGLVGHTGYIVGGHDWPRLWSLGQTSLKYTSQFGVFCSGDLTRYYRIGIVFQGVSYSLKEVLLEESRALLWVMIG